jgi:hypothetical protein
MGIDAVMVLDTYLTVVLHDVGDLDGAVCLGVFGMGLRDMWNADVDVWGGKGLPLTTPGAISTLLTVGKAISRFWRLVLIHRNGMSNIIHSALLPVAA